MSCVNVTAVKVLNNPALFSNPLQFEVSFECIAPLTDDLEWKMIYVGSAESEQYDQEIESVLVGPVEMGINRFIFQGEPPESSRIPKEDLIGVTVVLLTCSYKEKEFIRIGYYVQNEWTNPAWNPPDGIVPEEVMAMEQIDVNLVQRNILADKPRVTRFHIPWDDEPAAQQQQQQQQEGQGMMQGQDMAQMQMQQQQMQMQMQQQQAQQMQQQGLASRDPNLMNPALGHDMMAQQKLSHLAAEQQATGMDMD